MSDYYTEQRAIGDAYEQFVCEHLQMEGLKVERCITKADQIGKGDLIIAGQPLEIASIVRERLLLAEDLD